MNGKRFKSNSKSRGKHDAGTDDGRRKYIQEKIKYEKKVKKVEEDVGKKPYESSLLYQKCKENEKRKKKWRDEGKIEKKEDGENNNNNNNRVMVAAFISIDRTRFDFYNIK